MSDPFFGEIKVIPFDFPPRGYAYCDGQLLAIAQNTALFSLLGTFYGGNGTSNFALPNLVGRVPLGTGQGPGLSNYVTGQSGGSAGVALSENETLHSHAVKGKTGPRDKADPSNAFLVPGDIYATAPTGATLARSVSPGGGASIPHENQQPFLKLNFVIALNGIFPSRG